MSTEGAPLELAHYYPGWIWDDASVGRMKSLLLYFDGFALGVAQSPPVTSGPAECGPHASTNSCSRAR
ncbi:hypothetical protein [Kitasatospora purpeofusca]|uniref:hypothetical protein n=1 Tax=Kitasatospora purpeofusca TaxID=67352 RepID=UPI003F4AF63A